MVTTQARRRQQPPRAAQRPSAAPVPAAPFPTPVTARAKPAKATVPKSASVPARKKSRRQLLADANLARRKETTKEKLMAHPARFLPRDPWVHVGNLDPALTVARLYAHFTACGPIEDLSIRLSGSILPGNPEMCYRYAVVRFETLDAAHAATKLNGSRVRDSKYPLVVDPSIYNLPEVANTPHIDLPALERATEERRRCQIPMTNLQTASGPASPLALAVTKVWNPPRPAVKKRRVTRGGGVKVVQGVSFKLTLT
ncbi:hypothetical protein FB451DRAFT_1366352 [Mycena latifolia]|nr:hypothetical protein FB451DRAFT_1366352 [Mycena latifolia]